MKDSCSTVMGEFDTVEPGFTYLLFEHSGNFDDSCQPCTIDSGKAGGSLVLKCNCLPKPDGVPKYTTLQIGANGKYNLTFRR